MSENKTKETDLSVQDFLNSLKDEKQKVDAQNLVNFIQEKSGHPPKMWGTSIIGFGSYHYKYESGRTGDSPLVGFSPRASAISLYLSSNFEERESLLQQLGKHKTGKGCVYIKSLADINLSILEIIILNHILHIQELYPD